MQLILNEIVHNDWFFSKLCMQTIQKIRLIKIFDESENFEWISIWNKSECNLIYKLESSFINKQPSNCTRLPVGKMHFYREFPWRLLLDLVSCSSTNETDRPMLYWSGLSITSVTSFTILSKRMIKFIHERLLCLWLVSIVGYYKILDNRNDNSHTKCVCPCWHAFSYA